MAAAVIEIDELTKSYRRGLRRSTVFAVQKLSMKVQPASIVAMMSTAIVGVVSERTAAYSPASTTLSWRPTGPMMRSSSW